MAYTISNGKNQNNKPPLTGIILLIIIAGLIWFYFGGGLEQKAAQDIHKIENQVALDAINC